MPQRLVASRVVRRSFLRSRPPISAVLSVLCAAAFAYLIAVNLSGYNSFIALFSVSIGLACVGIFAIGIRVLTQSKSEQALQVFEDLFSTGPDLAFLTSTSGDVLSHNAPLQQSDDVKRTELASFLTAQFDGAPSLIYRILRYLEKDDRCAENVTDRSGADWKIEARRCYDDAVIWTVSALEKQGGSEQNQPVPGELVYVLSDASGQITLTNEAAREVGFDVGTPIVQLDEPGFGLGGICKLDGRPNTSFRSYKFEREDGAAETVFIPIDSEDLAGATPNQFLESLPVALARIAADGQLIYVNSAAQNLLGKEAKEGVALSDLMEGLGRSMRDRIRDMMDGRVHMRSEVARAFVNGQEVFLQVTLNRLKLNGETTLLAVLNDATELKTLEAQFVQSQKMQAVGQLAGGVAHDFNNLLTAINGHCDLIIMRHETGDTDYGDLIQIRHNANRAASLVGQLLAFSRKQTLVPKVVDLYDTLSDLNHLLNRLLGEKVTLKIDHGEDLPRVRVDERQLEQVIMNLVVNARDAMPNGGEVVIETMKVDFEKDFQRDRAVIPFGCYVQIDVSDTGTGIPRDKIAKIFEPFFTTKRVGEGTGLGLSTAYGIIKQTGGFIFAQSEVGAGTTFTIYLPTYTQEQAAAVAVSEDKEEPTDLTGRGVVLLVEDEVPVRSFAARALNIRGYTVIEAASAEEALEILESDDLEIDVFVSDVIMPGMDGPTWVRMAQEKRPDTRVVFVSGYAEDVFEGGQISVPNATFLPKPFSLNELTHTVKQQLEASPS